MIAYEIQLWYVIRDKIRDKIQSGTKSSLRQNSVQDKTRGFFVGKKSIRKSILSEKKSQILPRT